MTIRLAHDWFPRDLPDNVVLGERSWLYSSFAFLHFESRCADAVVVGPDSGVYHDSFFELGPAGRVRIGHHCTVVGATFRTDRRIEVGDWSFLAHEVVLADTFAPVPPSADSAPTTVDDAPSIVVGENCWVGARVVLLAGARLGEGSVVGAGTVVDFEVPPFCVVAGDPPRIVHRLRGT